MLKEFKEFALKGNVMDLAIGVIIGSAFTQIVDALTSSFIKPLLALIGGAEVQGKIPLGNSGQALDYGAFITAVLNFLIIAFVLFLMMKAIKTADKRNKERLEALAKKLDEKGIIPKKKTEEIETEPETKICPYCLSEIKYRATRCPHCTAELEKIVEKAVEDLKD